MTYLAMLSGVAVVLGLLLAASGARLRPVRPRQTVRWLRLPDVSPERAMLVGGCAVGVLLFTRWPVAAVAAGLAAAVASSPASRPSADKAEKAEAVTTWAEMLRDATGTPRGIEGVLVATAREAPALIRPHVLRLARRLPYEPLDDALDGLAEDLDHALGDLVVTALRLSARGGGRQVRAVLDDLAAVAREEARMHRRLEVARARPRSDMRTVLALMAGFVGVFVFFARDYLDPYSTPLGQVVLAGVAMCWAAGVFAMVRLGRMQPVERFLARRVTP